MSSKTKMATFQVNNTDPAHVMLDKLNSYVTTLKKEKYNNLLKLLNELFEKKNFTLRHFTDIEYEYFETKSLSKTIKILEEHKPKFNYDIDKLKKHYAEKKSKKNVVPNVSIAPAKNIEIKVKSKNSSSAEEFSASKEIFLIISKLLKAIEYKLVKFTKANKYYYSIVMYN